MAIIEPRRHPLPDGRALVIRTPDEQDAHVVLAYLDAISRESSYLSFGPGEFSLTESAERAALREFASSGNRLALLGLVDDVLVSLVTFIGGPRPRNRHTGEFGLSVSRTFWGLGIAGLMLDTLIDWAKTDGVVTKINLRVRTDNARAIGLYERKGFVLEGTVSRDLRVDGVYYDHHVMGLAVDGEHR